MQSYLNVGSKSVTPPYEWYDSAADGKISAIFRGRVIKYGCYSTAEREASFRVTFDPQEIMSSGQLCWPLGDDFRCIEDPDDFTIVTRKILLPQYFEDSKNAIWYGRYRGYTADGRTEFIIDENYSKDMLFVSTAPLRSSGNLYNCDVIITRDFNAMPISCKKLREILRN